MVAFLDNKNRSSIITKPSLQTRKVRIHHKPKDATKWRERTEVLIDYGQSNWKHAGGQDSGNIGDQLNSSQVD